MSKTLKDKAASAPKFQINIVQNPKDLNYYKGEFLKDGAVIYDTGDWNSYIYVFATLEPRLRLAPHQ